MSSTVKKNTTAKVDLWFVWSVVPVLKKEVICGMNYPSFLVQIVNMLTEIIWCRFHSETECGHFRSWICPQCAAIYPTEIALNEHIGSHLPNGIKCELECDNIPPLEFASTECTINLEGVKTLEQSIDADFADSPFYDLMEIDQSQYSNDEQSRKESLDLVKEETADPIDG